MRRAVFAILCLVALCGDASAWRRGSLPSYVGLVASRGGINVGQYGTCTGGGCVGGVSYAMSRKGQYARVAIDNSTASRLVFANWYADQLSGANVEVPTGATASYTATIEYPSGTIASRVTFSGSNTGTAASGDTLLSDPIVFSGSGIPKDGKFFVRVWQNIDHTAGHGVLAQSGIGNTSMGDQSNCSQDTPVTDETGFTTSVTGSCTNASGGIGTLGPIAVIGVTNAPSICGVGDSRMAGSQDQADTTGDIGNTFRSIGPFYNYWNMGISGTRAQNFLGNNAKRTPLINTYCTHVIVEYTINDLAQLRTAAQIETDLASIYTLYSGKRVYQNTIEPRTSLAAPQQTDNVTVNHWIRANTAGITGFFEIANLMASAVDASTWRSDSCVGGAGAPAWTPDNLHENQCANRFIASSGAIPATFPYP